MKCLKCGAELSEDTKFCSYCGAKVEAQTEIPPIPPEVEEADEPKTEEKYTYQNNEGKTCTIISKSVKFIPKAQLNNLILLDEPNTDG